MLNAFDKIINFLEKTGQLKNNSVIFKNEN